MTSPNVSTVCRECGASYSAEQIDIFTECLKCGEPFLPGLENDKRPPLNPAEFRQLVRTAVEQENGVVALELLETHLPPHLAALGELSRAVIALMGECRCAAMKFPPGQKPGAKEPCPHYRAARALRRVGLTEGDIATLRQSIPIRMR